MKEYICVAQIPLGDLVFGSLGTIILLGFAVGVWMMVVAGFRGKLK